MGRPRRKFVFLLVEGKTDRRALYGPISSLFDSLPTEGESYDVRCFLPEIDGDRGGDITSYGGICRETIEKEINKRFLRAFFKGSHPYVYPKDVSEVIHIVDLDGAFVPDENVIAGGPGPDAEKGAFYDDPLIWASDVEEILRRNRQKSLNVGYLSTLSEIEIGRGGGKRKVPYSIYYFSANLDHFIAGDANMPSSEKINAADSFSRLCGDDHLAFMGQLRAIGACVEGMSYDESWEHAIEGTNSLSRGSNINLLFERFGLWQAFTCDEADANP